MAELRHAPYAGTDPPMAIGLKALDLAQWIEPDEHLTGELAEKRRLLAERHSEVYAERSDSRPAQAEVLALLAEHLPRVHPEIYRRDGSRIQVIPAGIAIEVDSPREVAARMCLAAGPGGSRADGAWRHRLAARRRLAVLPLHLGAGREVRPRHGRHP